MENECLLDMNTETISPPSSLKDQSLNSFSHNFTGRLGVNLGTETVIHETKNPIIPIILPAKSTKPYSPVVNLHDEQKALRKSRPVDISQWRQ